jgi:hypothetical protein
MGDPASEEIFNPADDRNLPGWREQLTRFPYPALSRVAPIYVCSSCGTDEAMRDFARTAPVPPDEWPIGGDDDAAA